MIRTNKNWPQVHGSSSDIPGDDDSQGRHGARAAMNPRVKSTHRQTTNAKEKDQENYLNIITYKTCSLRTENHLKEFENVLKDVK